MKKFIIPALLAAATLAPAAATAEGKPITVEVSYDKVLLASDMGASIVMESVEKQAKSACTTRSPVTNQAYTDRECAKNVTKSAMKKILENQEVSGLDTSPVFARQAVTLVADAGQR
ncbi:MAG: UrcA family protein [Alphaproteobacteria bacterium]|nr:hypothetical protein [Hyphomonas sp.]MBR9806904.1 UrcA family protein [Alphaproteobacteria bacterium]|tara:strand:- start:4 stop:354 length:351 start_codon:yes stop_codon:yes gene_type:complete